MNTVNLLQKQGHLNRHLLLKTQILKGHKDCSIPKAASYMLGKNTTDVPH